MNKLSIIHYDPIEYYPPTTNLIDVLSENEICIKIHTNNNNKKRTVYQNISTSIYRSTPPITSNSKITRLIKYIIFNLKTLLLISLYRPTYILYYESISSWPAYFYTKYINRKCGVFIHYHEYASQEWYTKYMKIVNYYHSKEKKHIYKIANWISQTNNDRLSFFHKDHLLIKKKQLKIMPNYPPKKWSTEKESISNVLNKTPIKTIYVGSLAFESTYIKEYCEWIISHNGNIIFDIYAYNLHRDVKDYLNTLNSAFINYFQEGIEYQQLPIVLKKYDVGLILYRPFNENYTYNAPNKLFEYLACNLDIWYPNALKGPVTYITKNTYPKIIPLNFNELNDFNWIKAIDKTNCNYQPSNYYCEEIYNELINKLLK